MQIILKSECLQGLQDGKKKPRRLIHGLALN